MKIEILNDMDKIIADQCIEDCKPLNSVRFITDRDIDVTKFKDQVDWYYTSKGDYSVEFFKYFFWEIEWRNVWRTERSQEFIETFIEKVDWYEISKYFYFTEEFLDMHSKNVNWKLISKTFKMSEKFIEKHKEKVNWKEVCRWQRLSAKFIEKNQDKMIFSSLLFNPEADTERVSDVILEQLEDTMEERICLQTYNDIMYE